MARSLSDAVSIDLAKRRYSEALAAYTLDQWRSLAQDLGLQIPSDSSSSSAQSSSDPSIASDTRGSVSDITGSNVTGVGAGRKDTEREIAYGLQKVSLSSGRGVPVT